MGALTYGGGNSAISFDDRSLLHLQIVITSKLRHGEGFLVSWMDSPGVGSGRSSIWVSTASTLLYRFHGTQTHSVNRTWIRVLMDSANSANGLVFTSEPVDATVP
ncbi:hypothetical protein B7R21_09000 [Subtercola boreus]|uniref:DUF7882 domain-containing protein n=1 Tax=Subtercola boreus TaxID=120213 RepID=A0A3E0VTM8_9MICO|nr:hypothetical protein B7R21_09000 [Subtercola boreus]